MLKKYTLMALMALLASAQSAWAAQDIERQQNLGLEPISADYFSELEDIINLGEENGANGEDVAALLFNNKQTAINKPHVDDGISNQRQGQKRKRAESYAAEEADQQPVLQSEKKRFPSSYQRFRCLRCGHEAPNLNLLERHQRTHTGEKPYVCEICKRGFARKDVLMQHVTIHTGEKPYVCECGESFNQRVKLNRHKNSKHKKEKVV